MNQKRTKPRSIPERITICVLLLVIVICLLALYPFFPIGPLFFGWIGFLERVPSRITWNIPMIGSALLALFFTFRIAHKLATRWGNWPLRRTLLATSLTLAFFVPAIAMTGIVHQSAWLMREPMYVKSPRFIRTQLRQAGNLIKHASRLQQHDPDQSAEFLDHARELLPDSSRLLLADSFDPIDIGGSEPRSYLADVGVPTHGMVVGPSKQTWTPREEFPPRVQQLLWGAIVKPGQEER